MLDGLIASWRSRQGIPDQHLAKCLYAGLFKPSTGHGVEGRFPYNGPNEGRVIRPCLWFPMSVV